MLGTSILLSCEQILKDFRVTKRDTAGRLKRVAQYSLSPTPKAMMQTTSLCIIYFRCQFRQKHFHVSNIDKHSTFVHFKSSEAN